MRGFIVSFFFILTAIQSGGEPAWSVEPVPTEASYAFLMDAETGAVLLNHHGDERMAPSSMSKILTTYLVFEDLKNGRIQLDDRLVVSERAWRVQGSKMFVELGASISVEDLIRGIVIQSGNDACVVIAEGLAGTEEAFVQRMNEKAKTLGLQNSAFKNPNGWPDPEQSVTAKDLALLAQRLINDFPEYYNYFAEQQFTYHKITQHNRNPLLGSFHGADGLKTGHTEEAGYGIVASAKRDDRRLILVVNGLKSGKNRKEEAQKILEWGFTHFENYTLLKSGQMVATTNTWYASESTAALTVTKDVVVTLPRQDGKTLLTAKILAPNILIAPLSTDQPLAQAVIEIPQQGSLTVPLYLTHSLDKANMFKRAAQAMMALWY